MIDKEFKRLRRFSQNLGSESEKQKSRSASRKYKYLRKYITEAALKLGVSEEVVETSLELADLISRKQLIIKNSKEGLAYATLYTACRLEEQPMPLEYFEDVLNQFFENNDLKLVNYFNHLRELISEFGIRIPLPEFIHYIPWVYKRVKKKYNFDETLLEDSLELGEKVKQAGPNFYQGFNPITIAAAIVYYNIPEPDKKTGRKSDRKLRRKISQEEMADLCYITIPTLRNFTKKLKTLGYKKPETLESKLETSEYELGTKLETLESKLETLEYEFGTKLETLESKLKTLEYELKTLLEYILEYKKLEILEYKKLKTLESKFKTLKSKKT